MKAPAGSMPAAIQATQILAEELTPVPVLTEHPRRAQSLAEGAAGIALLHIERAHADAGSWKTAHQWVRAATRAPISAADDTCLYFGVPAISLVLQAAGADEKPRYGAALTEIDARVTALAHRRVDLALERIAAGQLPVFAEYDLLHGLTGIGAHLLSHSPGSDALGRILAYLVRLTEPLYADGQPLPGWWTIHDPHLNTSPRFPGGHGNLGAAHGVAGPLTLLAQTMRAGITVAGHTGAISSVCAFLDSWRQDGPTGPWWPQWVTRHDLHTGTPSQTGPARPSWCYGTPGIAFAQQAAAIATGNLSRRQIAEHALAACLSDPAQLSLITDTSLCHGWAGLYQTTIRTARDALTPQISAALPHLTEQLIRHTSTEQNQPAGLLEGRAGLALALHTATHTTPSISGWDTCLMLN